MDEPPVKKNDEPIESADNIRRRAEQLLLEKKFWIPEDILTFSPEKNRAAFHELRVHQIELEMQNEELRHTQSELNALHTRYFDLYDLAPVSYITVSDKGIISNCNITASNQLGLKRADLIDRPLSRFFFKEDQDIYYLLRSRLIQTNERQTGELRMVKKDGSFFWVQIEATATQDEDYESADHPHSAGDRNKNSPTVLHIVLVDISERKQKEQALLEAHWRLVGMAGGIAHELRNPLGIISASAQLLMENPKDAKLRAQGLNKINTATRRASLIIENLLKFARPAGGWEKKEINLTTIVDETLALLSNQIDSQNVVVSVTYQPNLPHLSGSHQMLQQVFANLILNACNAMTEGGSLTIAVKASSPRQVEIHFIDTGHGISPENLNKIFDPFFTTMPVGKGVGLGLSVSHTIIQQHQGVIEVHSEVGKGSDFIVQLPSIL